VKSFTIAYKAGLPASGMRPVNNQPFTGAMWYKTILENASCNLGDGLYTTKPDGYYTATDAIHVSANLSPFSTQSIKFRCC